MLKIIKNTLTAEQCLQIIQRVNRTTRWFVVQQDNVKVDTVKCYIKPHIEDILKHTSIKLDETTAVELLKYETGSCSKLHMDVEGTHLLSVGNYIETEWKQTAIVLLNNEFSGGELSFPEINSVFGKDCVGDLIVFPAGKDSFPYSHQVSEVTSGTRYTLVFRYI